MLSIKVKRKNAEGIECEYEVTPGLRFVERLVSDKPVEGYADIYTQRKVSILQQMHIKLVLGNRTTTEWFDVEEVEEKK